MTASQYQRLRKTLEKGKARFVILTGGVAFGGITASIYSAINYFWRGPLEIVELLISYVVFPLGGILWGLSMWRFFHKQMEKYEEQGA